MGVNFYNRSLLGNPKELVPEAEFTHMDWEVHPPALYRLLLKLHTEYKLPPLYITIVSGESLYLSIAAEAVMILKTEAAG